jgi:hypothetical protein
MRKRTFNTFVYAVLSCLMLVLAGTSAEAYFAYSGYNPGLSLSLLDARAIALQGRPGIIKDQTFVTLRNSEPTYVFVVDNRRGRYAVSVAADSGTVTGNAREGRRVRRTSAMARLIAPAR